ncbi:polymorphic toxin type 27 domain-containing protein [Kitasatospora sp. McL0602]|uniref:polymorphic toxin type 27 domain-containing protein n=1 Tax=Kitasatospora sp. McL0602 TaxID=3439530 RepID=UPI003F890AF0
MAADQAPAPATPVSVLPDTPRAQVIGRWKSGGPAVKAAAESALVGGDTEVRHFLDVDQAAGQVLDDRQLALQVISVGGRAVREAAKTALADSLAGNPANLRTFLDSGWKPLQEQDERVQVVQLVTAGGRGLKEAGRKALDGTEDDVRAFLDRGRYAAQESDDRVALVQLVSAGGPTVKSAGKAALDGSTEDISEFLKVGQYVARSRDQEHATVADLAEQVTEAGAEAQRESDQATEDAARATDAAGLARQAAEQAATETQAAQGDATRAAAAAARAAEAGRRAAQAAQAAVGAAQAATRSARLAASAASEASAAADGALQAASRALNAAAAATTDRDKAAYAAQVVKDNELIITSAMAVAAAARHAAVAAQAADYAAKAAADASTQTTATADATDQAATYADAAGVSSDEARAAAATTRRHAAEASRAAKAASSLAHESADAANESADAADSAVKHAQDASALATQAVQHAGEAAIAADQSKLHAAAATEAANAASARVEKAKTVEQLARKTEDEDLTSRTNAGIEEAKDLKAALDLRQSAAAKAIDDAKKLDTDAAAAAAEAAQPGADQATVAAKGRRMALAAMKTRGPWSQSAAAFALAGDDLAVDAYVRNLWRTSAQQDERTRLLHPVDDKQSAAVAAATTAALKGGPDQVHAFLTTGRDQVAAPDYRVQIVQLVTAGGRGVQEAGRAALATNTVDALVTFLNSGQYTARDADERVRAVQLLGSGGKEVQAAARIALEGPQQLLHAFIESGQYKAQHKDAVTAQHVAAVEQMIADSAAVAATAQQNAAEAARQAALARKASEEADSWALKAQDSAQQAAGFAAQAVQSATEAKADADKAADAARTAASAEQTAQRAASSADHSADWATAAAQAARGFADLAAKAHDDALAAAKTAHKTSVDAELDAAMAYESYMMNQEEQKAWEQQFDQLLYDQTKERLDSYKSSFDTLGAIHLLLDVVGLIPVAGEFSDLASCGLYALEKNWVDAGLSCASAIPIEGYVASAVKFEKWGEKGAELLKKLTRDKLGDAPSELPPLVCLTRAAAAAGNSFPAGTRVLMADGTTAPIERIRIGQQVLAGDPGTARTSARRVDDTIVTPDDRDFTDLTVTAADGTSAKVTSTDHHPYWSANLHTWRDAADLVPGDSVLTAAGRPAQIAAVRHWKTLQPAYNLTVNALHTYYVLAGSTPVLVHNSSELGKLCEDGDHIVLGINPASDDLATALSGGARTFNDIKYGKPYDNTGKPKWMVGVEQAIENENVTLSVTLDGVKDEELSKALNTYTEAQTPERALELLLERGRPLIGPNWTLGAQGGNGTAWEVALLRLKVILGKRKWEKINWYWKGKNYTTQLTKPGWAED